MTLRVYLMPRIGGGLTAQDARRPKYLSIYAGALNAAIHYGPEPYCMVVADVDAGTHTAIVANADVRAIPEDLNSTITNGARTTIITTLESGGIPGQWVTNGMTYRVLVRRLAGMFFLLQNVSGRKFRLLQIALDDPVSALPANARQAMSDAADTLELDSSGITGATTLRAALANIGSQFAARPLLVLGASI